jgi:hypothetical protein
MSLCMSTLNEAYVTETHPWEKKDNPQRYDNLVVTRINPDPKRHILGLVGGNEVSPIQGNMVDLESDLRGINIPNTFCPWRQYQPPAANAKDIQRSNWKGDVKIDTQPMHLPAYQMWAYPGMPTPLPLRSEVCKNPEKY